MSQLLITTIQTNLHWEDKAANLAMLQQKIAAAGKTEVVVLPEMFSTGFSMQPAKLAEPMDGPTVEWMKKVSAENRVILTGSLIIEEDGQYFNRLIWMLPNGHFGYYNKRHLFAFAGEHQHYTPGQKRLIASVKGWKINLQVCYDLRFPVWARQSPAQFVSGEAGDGTTTNQHRPEYDVLVYVANWPERRSHAWRSLLMARAIENQCYVVAVNRVGNDGNNIYHSGDTLIIDPLGETIYHGQHLEESFTATLSKEHLDEVRNKFPFWRDADGFVIEH
jgi:omega-amidase